MFETLFRYPSVLNRHRNGPAADERQRYLIHQSNQGVARGTLLRNARELLVVAKNINVTTGQAIDPHDIEVAADKWARQQQRRGRSHGPRCSKELFLQVGTSWLRFLGRLQEPEPAPSPFAALIEDFVDYMRYERGLSEATIRARCWHAKKLLTWLASQNRDLRQASLRDVDAFLSVEGGQHWGRVSVATCAKALRAFFRHAEMRGWCARGISAGINGPRLFTQEALPVGPAWVDVQRLITSANGHQPRDIRDRAILMLFAMYSFRRTEVAGLRLEQINWEHETITILRPKQRCTQEYPRPRSVGQSIIRYSNKSDPVAPIVRSFSP